MNAFCFHYLASETHSSHVRDQAPAEPGAIVDGRMLRRLQSPGVIKELTEQYSEKVRPFSGSNLSRTNSALFSS